MSTLPTDPRRQAVPSLTGYVYQAWISIDMWLELRDETDSLYLECAEDVDVVRKGNAVAVQIKHEQAKVSLGQLGILKVLENFWTLVLKTPGRDVRFHYLSTGGAAQEQGLELDQSGIYAWDSARTDCDVAKILAEFLESKLPADSQLAIFLRTASTAEIQKRFISPFTWIMGGPELPVIKESVLDRICSRLDQKQMPTTLAEPISAYLQLLFWEQIVQPKPEERKLTLGMLLRQWEKATTVYLPIPVHQISGMFENPSAYPQILDVMLEAFPPPPIPLLPRRELIRSVAEQLDQHRLLALNGAVGMGKTTIAKLVCTEHHSDAWWISLAGYSDVQANTLLLALLRKLDDELAPTLVVLDNFNSSQSTLVVLEHTLQLMLHRFSKVGVKLLLTTTEPLSNSLLGLIKEVDIPALSEGSIDSLCIALGCAPETSTVWARFVTLSTRGHPKLVQARLAELNQRDWPEPGPVDFITLSPAVETVQNLSRHLVSQQYPPPVASFLYTAAALTIPMDRILALGIAGSIDGLQNPGDIIDELSGRWLERTDNDRLAVTPLLQGAAEAVWPPEELQAMHGRIYDVIVKKGTINELEAASMLFHAYLSDIDKKIAHCAIQIQKLSLQDTVVSDRVLKQLSWFTYVKLEHHEMLVSEPMTDALLRSLQFRVAIALEHDHLPKVVELWIETVDRIEHEGGPLSESMLWISVAICQSKHITLDLKLQAIIGIFKLRNNASADSNQQLSSVFDSMGSEDPTLSSVQVAFLYTISKVNTLEALNQFTEWLTNSADELIRSAIDDAILIPIFQSMGAFVHSAWGACYSTTEDWNPWLVSFDRIFTYAQSHSSPNIGREAAKAKSIILSEYRSDVSGALSILKAAEEEFGPSLILSEQKANVYFQANDHNNALRTWEEVEKQDSLDQSLEDPFAFRRFALSLTRVDRHAEAAGVFISTAQRIKPDELEKIKVGLLVDAALCWRWEKRYQQATQCLVSAATSLNSGFYHEGDGHWEAVQRAASTTCQQIREDWQNNLVQSEILYPGRGSDPGNGSENSESGQTQRSAMLMLDIAKLAVAMDIAFDSQLLNFIESEKLYDIPYIRNLSNEWKLGSIICNGQAEGFLAALINLHHSTLELISTSQSTLLTPDKNPALTIDMDISTWYGVIVSWVSCSALSTKVTLEHLSSECEVLLPEDSILGRDIKYTLTALTDPGISNLSLIRNVNNSPILRGVAAIELLENKQPVRDTANLQLLIASICVGGTNRRIQTMFNRHMATKFAPIWLEHCQNPIALLNPRHNVPTLREICSSVDSGNSTLRDLLHTAAIVSGIPLASLNSALW